MRVREVPFASVTELTTVYDVPGSSSPPAVHDVLSGAIVPGTEPEWELTETEASVPWSARHRDAMVDGDVRGTAGDVGLDHGGGLHRRLAGVEARRLAGTGLQASASAGVAGAAEAAAGRGHGQAEQDGDQHRSSGAQDGHRTPRR